MTRPGASQHGVVDEPDKPEVGQRVEPLSDEPVPMTVKDFLDRLAQADVPPHATLNLWVDDPDSEPGYTTNIPIVDVSTGTTAYPDGKGWCVVDPDRPAEVLLHLPEDDEFDGPVPDPDRVATIAEYLGAVAALGDWSDEQHRVVVAMGIVDLLSEDGADLT